MNRCEVCDRTVGIGVNLCPNSLRLTALERLDLVPLFGECYKLGYERLRAKSEKPGECGDISCTIRIETLQMEVAAQRTRCDAAERQVVENNRELCGWMESTAALRTRCEKLEEVNKVLQQYEEDAESRNTALKAALRGWKAEHSRICHCTLCDKALAALSGEKEIR